MTAVMVSLAAVERDEKLNSLDSFIVRYGNGKDIKSKNSCNCASCEEPLDDTMVADGEEEVNGPLLDIYCWTSQICSVTLPSAYAFVCDLLVGKRSSICNVFRIVSDQLRVDLDTHCMRFIFPLTELRLRSVHFCLECRKYIDATLFNSIHKQNQSSKIRSTVSPLSSSGRLSNLYTVRRNSSRSQPAKQVLLVSRILKKGTYSR